MSDSEGGDSGDSIAADARANADLNLFESGDFADGIIMCGNRAWNVHRNILAFRCKWFKRAFFGNHAEASSGKVRLDDHDPDMIDILLYFIYARDGRIPKLTHGRGTSMPMPTFCVKLCRLATFFLLFDVDDKNLDLYIKAESKLRAHLDKILSIPIGDANDIKNNPERAVEVSEVFDAVRESYKDNSTFPVRRMLLNFLWTRKGAVFEQPEVQDMLEEIPSLGKDLMNTYISLGATPNIPGSLNRNTCLRVLEAVCDIEIGSGNRNPHYEYPGVLRSTDGQRVETSHGVKFTCCLRPTPGLRSPFEVVNGDTDTVIRNLDWLVPLTCHAQRLRVQDSPSRVCVPLYHPDNLKKRLFIRFETSEHAQFYAKYYSEEHGGIQPETWGSVWIGREMRSSVDNAMSSNVRAAERGAYY